MHPYDRWGFSTMSAEQDCLYFEYAAARFSAYRNVWWSLANEYDIMLTKSPCDWERLGNLLRERDPYGHPRSIHNCREIYDFNREWVTHCSIQRTDSIKCEELADKFRTDFQKPVVLDEIVYEGNIEQGWGNMSGEELVRRFWEATARGGYATHGETYAHPENILWWSHGGKLRGESPRRIKFLREEILEKIPGRGLKPTDNICGGATASVDEDGGENKFLLHYFGLLAPEKVRLELGSGKWNIELIDTWDMVITDMGTLIGACEIKLPGKKYLALRITKIG